MFPQTCEFQVIGQVADKAMPLAFQQLERERARQLSTAQRVPSLTAVGGALEDIQRQQNMAPQQSLAQYYNTVAPIAFGLPTQQNTSQAPAPNAFGMAAGGAMTGASMGSMFGGPAGAMTGAAIGGLGGVGQTNTPLQPKIRPGRSGNHVESFF